jgi:hypothetical protein
LQSSNYIQFGYWDSLKKGLLSGERLYLDLKRLENAYLDQNKRDFEITKNISLVLLDPVALISLKETGQCYVSLPESFFDTDYPGHYMRRIKSIGLTIPCVTGPYTSVNCTLTLTQSKIRWGVDPSGSYAEQPGGNDPRFFYNFAATQSIATSSAQGDSGLFELNFHDERYLPFEGGGAVSNWVISMPKDCNAFDFESITDVVFNLKYTSRDGGQAFANLARAAAVIPPGTSQSSLANSQTSNFPKQPNLVRFFSLKHEFPTEWSAFLSPAAEATSQAMTIALIKDRFPYIYRGKTIQIVQFDVALKFRNSYPVASNATPLGDYAAASPLVITLIPPAVNGANPPALAPLSLASNASVLNGLPRASVPPTLGSGAAALGAPGKWSLNVAQADIQKIAASLQTVITSGSNQYAHLNAAVIEDIFLVCHFVAS